jgi:hypothetical protein
MKFPTFSFTLSLLIKRLTNVYLIATILFSES